jgi:hypothetical protein
MAGVVGALSVLPVTAEALTWVALILVPIGAALALGWAAHGARLPLALLAVPLLAVAWTLPGDRVGQAAATILMAASAVTAGRLLVGAGPLLRSGVVAMALIDAVLVFSGHINGPNALLVAASPGAGLPQLQSASFGPAALGYGDLFAAAVVGGMLAADRSTQIAAAVGLVVVTLAWDQLFLVYSALPATIPPAVVLLAATPRRRRAHMRARLSTGGLEPALAESAVS